MVIIKERHYVMSAQVSDFKKKLKTKKITYHSLWVVFRCFLMQVLDLFTRYV